MPEKTELQLLVKALAFAAHKHRDQRRIDVHASPYIVHPIALTDVLVNEAEITDTTILCGSLLHDTIEDTETTVQELKEAFGEEITSIVLEVTDDKELDKHVRKQAQIDHAPHLSRKAKAVKLADKISNLRDIVTTPPSDWSLDRRQRYFDWSKTVIDGLRGDWPILEDKFDQAFAQRPQ